MLVALRISNRRVWELAKLTKVHLCTATESFPILWNHQIVCSHCIISDRLNVACWGHCETECCSCTKSLFLCRWAHSYQRWVVFPAQTLSLFLLGRSLPAPSVPRTASLTTRSRAPPQMSLVARPLKTLPPCCGIPKIHCRVQITPLHPHSSPN
jgi:hypothetical protein